MSDDRFAASAREYVESLHQNSRTHLLYGKNNVLVQPVLLQNPPTITTSSLMHQYSLVAASFCVFMEGEPTLTAFEIGICSRLCLTRCCGAPGAALALR